MLIIVQYQQLAVTKLKLMDINTADCCSMRAIICYLLISCCEWLPFWSEYFPQNSLSTSLAFVINLDEKSLLRHLVLNLRRKITYKKHVTREMLL